MIRKTFLALVIVLLLPVFLEGYLYVPSMNSEGSRSGPIIATPSAVPNNRLALTSYDYEVIHRLNYHFPFVATNWRSLEEPYLIIREIFPPKYSKDAIYLENPSQEFVAITYCQYHCRIVVEEKISNTIVEISASSFQPWRNYSDLKWISDEVFVVDQWTMPHSAVHYEINVVTGKIMNFYPFSDLQPSEKKRHESHSNQ